MKHIRPKIRNLRTRKKIFQRPVFWIIVFVLIVIFTAFYFIFFFSKFQVTAITISGNEKINSKDIEDLAWKYVNKKILNIPYKSIFTINGNVLKKSILTGFPGIREVKIQKSWFQNINLEIKERQPFAIFCGSENPEECFFVDENGVIFESSADNSQYAVIKKESGVSKSIGVGDNAIEKNIMGAIYDVKKNLEDNFQISVKEVFVSPLLIFKTSENWSIYFDSNSDFKLQIVKMNVLLKDEIPASQRKNIQHIYLQYKDRAYYK